MQQQLTRVRITDVLHHFGCAFDVNFHATGFQTFDDDAHPTERRNKIEDSNYTQLEEMRML